MICSVDKQELMSIIYKEFNIFYYSEDYLNRSFRMEMIRLQLCQLETLQTTSNDASYVQSIL